MPFFIVRGEAKFKIDLFSMQWVPCVKSVFKYQRAIGPVSLTSAVNEGKKFKNIESE